ncbi:MAG: hypothetical protein FWF51_04440 [Chitinivibrionia bacterium]|nr:hypothetical protein [Chitinivibrionia bacterium]
MNLTDIKNKGMIDYSKEFLVNLFGDQIQDIRVEEIWQDKSNIHFTFSFLSPRASVFMKRVSQIDPLFNYERLYKEVVIDKNGENITKIKMQKNA